MSSWIKEAIFYHIYPLGFCNSPKINLGEKAINRIDKIIEWIPHMKELSINALYLGPIFESVVHGYDTKDYLTIDTRLGSNDDFKKVCKSIHDNGIKIILDGVFNHVGREFWAFKDIQKNGPSSKYCNWFVNVNFNGRSPEGDNFCYEGWNGYYSLVKLNINNEEVVNYLLEVVGKWIDEFDIDGIRLDAADYMDRNFFNKLRNYCDGKKKDFFLVGEVIHGDYNLWANKDRLNSVTNYECYKGIYSSHNEKNYFEIGYSLNRQFGNGAIYRDIPLYNFVDNHDVDRIASIVNNKEYLKNIYTLLFTMPGIPSIYYGSEWGIEGIHKNNSDDELRPSLELDKIEGEYEKLYDHIKLVADIRSKSKVLCYGDYSQVVTKNQQLIYKRSFENKEVYVVLNLADKEETLEFPLSDNKTLKNKMDNNKIISSDDGKVLIRVPAFTSYILEEI